MAATGIEVHGEEFGGPAVDSRWVWVLDPIDGTINYAAGSPLAAILLGLLHDGVPVAGLTWMPFTDQRYTAVAGGPLIKNGVPQPPLADAELANVLVGVGTFSADSRASSRGDIDWRCWKSSAECHRGCACTDPPASISSSSLTGYSVVQ